MFGLFKEAKPISVYDMIKEKQNKVNNLSTLSSNIDSILGGKNNNIVFE